MERPLRTGERGASLPVILVAVLFLITGTIVAFKLAKAPSHSGSLVAAGAAAEEPTTPKDQSVSKSRSAEDVEKADLTAKCKAAITKAKTAGETKFKVGQKVNDDCTAAIKTNDPVYGDAGGYKCVGKSAQVQMLNNGTLNINWQANPNVPPGKCATVACKDPSYDRTITQRVSGYLKPDVSKLATGKCFATEMNAINRDAVRNNLRDENPDVRTYYYIGSGTDARPLSSLDSASLAVLNQALGKDPYDESGYIPLDSKKLIASPAYDQIKQLAEDSPNTKAEEISKEITLNPDVNDPNQLSLLGKNGCDGHGCYAYPKDEAERKYLESRKNGWVCDTASTGSGVACFNPNVNAFKEGPLPPKDPRDKTEKAPPYQPPGPQQQTFNKDDPWKFTTGQGPWGQQTLGGQQPPAGNGVPQPPGSCNPSFICGNNTLYSRNNQCVDTATQQCQYGCSGTQCAQPPQQGNNCPTAPAQPNPSGCTNGTWKPTYGGTNNSCVSGWQCVPGAGGDTGAPTAQLSCQPQVADVGMTVSITYSCSAGTSSGSGFSTNGAQSGATSTVLTAPPGNTNTATFGLTCSNEGRSGSAQCSVQVAKPGIVLVANPKSVQSGKTSALGWVTAGMQSCVISSPDLSAFTAQNLTNTSVNGTATTPPLTAANNTETPFAFLLHCTTIGGGTRDATTTVTAKP